MKLNLGGRELQVDSRFLLSVLLILTNAACSDRATDSDPPPTQAKSDSYFEIGLGDRIVSIQLAVTPSEMERGLMFRKSLDPNQGMLFVYPDARKRSFWMRNTSIPLDIGFFSRGGILREVYPLYPYDESSVASRGEEIQLALEMNQGWFAMNGVPTGAKIDLEALTNALKQRGFDLDTFNFQ